MALNPPRDGDKSFDSVYRLHLLHRQQVHLASPKQYKFCGMSCNCKATAERRAIVAFDDGGHHLVRVKHIRRQLGERFKISNRLHGIF